jgi:hypothetical protein
LDNPADLCSRGIHPGNLNELFQFHQGPPFLLQDPSEWETWAELEEPDEIDVNVIRVFAYQTKDLCHAIDKCASYYSSKIRLQRVIGWCLRLISNTRLKVKGLKMKSGELGVDELGLAIANCLPRAQEVAFAEELHCLSNGLDLPNRSKLLVFKPFLDGFGKIRAGGKLQNAQIDYASKHPVILPYDQPITRLIVWDHHVKNYHSVKS